MIGTSEEIVRWLFNQDREIKFEIKEHKEKRGLKANSYCWILLGEIANVIGSTKEAVYKEYIKDKGIYRIITMSTTAVPTFKRVWEERGLGWVCETSETNIDGLTDVFAYYGTSTYNSKQMSYFIDYVVQEAKELGIETLPPDEIQRLKTAWQ